MSVEKREIDTVKQLNNYFIVTDII